MMTTKMARSMLSKEGFNNKPTSVLKWEVEIPQ